MSSGLHWQQHDNINLHKQCKNYCPFDPSDSSDFFRSAFSLQILKTYGLSDIWLNITLLVQGKQTNKQKTIGATSLARKL